MDKLERPIVKLNAMILTPLLHGKEKTRDNYIASIEEFERKIEKSLIETFSKLDIQSSVKTDPYSLPFKEEIIVDLRGESYLNGPFEIYRVTRKVVKELLIKDVHNLRFYMFVNVITTDNATSILDVFGKVEYRFRYYVK